MSYENQIEEQLIQEIRNNLNRFLSVDPVTKELYGYSKVVINPYEILVLIQEKGLTDEDGEFFETCEGFIEHCLEGQN
tara:strand:+ start:661 stop:894 length:234 start_codon:yes stop_codon:yes gene_type:complete